MDFIKEYTILTNDECNHIITYFYQHDPVQSRISSINRNETKVKKHNALTAYVHERDFIDPVFSKIIHSLELYTQNHMYLPHMYYVQLSIKKYIKEQGYFKQHVDANTIALSKRFLTFIVYLNDVYEGGETIFTVNNIKKIITPKKGNMIIFPPFWMFPHEGLVPISNDKYILVGHLHMII